MWFRSLLIVSFVALFLLGVSEAIAGWEYKELKDEFDDTITYIAISRGDKGHLGVGCNKEGKRFLVRAQERISRFHYSGTVDIKYRFDAAPAVKSIWSWSRGQAINLESPHEFSKLLMNHTEVIIKIEDGDTMKFSLKGSRTAIEKVVAACK